LNLFKYITYKGLAVLCIFGVFFSIGGWIFAVGGTNWALNWLILTGLCVFFGRWAWISSEK
jgi:hypothetical protein